VARSIVGAQAPLGHRQADGIAQRRNETSTNVGTARHRQRSAGNLDDVQQMNEDEMNEYLHEGVDDDVNPRPAQRRRTAAPRNGRIRRIVDFSADRNDPVTRFNEIQHGFETVSMLSDAIRQNMNAPLPEPRRTGRDVANDYEHAASNYHSAVQIGDELDIHFWNTRRTNLRAELAVIESSIVNSNESRSHNNE
jgi:hypothetical protein